MSKQAVRQCSDHSEMFGEPLQLSASYVHEVSDLRNSKSQAGLGKRLNGAKKAWWASRGASVAEDEATSEPLLKNEYASFARGPLASLSSTLGSVTGTPALEQQASTELEEKLQQQPIPSYSQVAEHAFGVTGRVFVDAMVHITLMGVSAVYLILATQFSQGLASEAKIMSDVTPRQFCLICSGFTLLHVLFENLAQLGWLSLFNLLTAVWMLIILIVTVTSGSASGGHRVADLDDASSLREFVSGSVKLAFAYGSHPVLPSIYASMRQPEVRATSGATHHHSLGDRRTPATDLDWASVFSPQKFAPMVSVAFFASSIFYLAVGIMGYWRYGDACCTNGLITFEDDRFAIALAETDIPRFCSSRKASQRSSAEQWYKWCPTYRADVHDLDRLTAGPRMSAYRENSRLYSFVEQAVLKALVCCIPIGIALFFAPNSDAFTNVLTLVSATTNTFTIYILPSIIWYVHHTPLYTLVLSAVELHNGVAHVHRIEFKLMEARQRRRDGRKGLNVFMQFPNNLKLTLSIVCVIVAIPIGIFGTWDAVQSLVDE
eukprot:scaffold2254_cov393-Prasinococcus_capsulatus_cf.AAC.6